MLLVATTINLQLDERRSTRRGLFQSHFFQTLELHSRFTTEAAGHARRRGVQDLFDHALDMIHAQTVAPAVAQEAYNRYRREDGAVLLQGLWAGHALIRIASRAPTDDRAFYQHLLDAVFSDAELALLVYEAHSAASPIALFHGLESSHLRLRAQRITEKDS